METLVPEDYEAALLQLGGYSDHEKRTSLEVHGKRQPFKIKEGWGRSNTGHDQFDRFVTSDK